MLRRTGFAALSLLWCISAGTGCSPQTEEEQEYFEARREAREEAEQFSTRMSSAREEEEIIQLVKEAETTTDDGQTIAYEVWLDQQLGLKEGEIFSQKWTVSNKGNENYEVKYSFTVVSDSKLPKKMAYAWNVNKNLDLVNEPTELDLTKKGIRNRTTIAEQRMRRERAESQFSLE